MVLWQVVVVDLVGREVVAAHRPEVRADQRGKREVRADDVIGELVRELRAHVGTRVATVRAEPLVAELGHELHPHRRGLAPADTGGDGDENTEPGSEGTTTSNASAGSPPKRSGCASGSIIVGEVPERPRPAVGEHERKRRGPEPRSCSACTVTPSISTRTCGHRFIAASCARQSYPSRQ